MTGPSRAFFSNLQLKKVEENTIYFEGTEMFADRINKENIQKLAKSSTGDRDPIFVLGMPRSGSTLVDQIISSHSKVD